MREIKETQIESHFSFLSWALRFPLKRQLEVWRNLKLYSLAYEETNSFNLLYQMMPLLLISVKLILSHVSIIINPFSRHFRLWNLWKILLTGWRIRILLNYNFILNIKTRYLLLADYKEKHSEQRSGKKCQRESRNKAKADNEHFFLLLRKSRWTFRQIL